MSDITKQIAIKERLPIDRTAAIVTSKAAEINKFQFQPRGHDIEAEKINVAAALKSPMPPRHIPDRRGEKFGRVEIVAFSHVGKVRPGSPGKRKSRGHGTIKYWVIRCACGNHELRSSISKALTKKPANAMCNECSFVEHLKYTAELRRTA